MSAAVAAVVLVTGTSGPDPSEVETAALPLELGKGAVQAGSLRDHTGRDNCARNQPRRPRDSNKCLFQNKRTKNPTQEKKHKANKNGNHNKKRKNLPDTELQNHPTQQSAYCNVTGIAEAWRNTSRINGRV
jgi:hypothetical protein